MLPSYIFTSVLHERLYIAERTHDGFQCVHKASEGLTVKLLPTRHIKNTQLISNSYGQQTAIGAETDYSPIQHILIVSLRRLDHKPLAPRHELPNRHRAITVASRRNKSIGPADGDRRQGRS